MKKILGLYHNAYRGLSPDIWWLSLVILINRSGAMVIPFMTLYLTESKHFDLGKAGIVMALFGAGAIAGGFLGGRLTDRIGFYPVQLATLAGGGCMFIVLSFISDFYWICACTFLLGLVNESFRPANAAAIAQYSNDGNRTRSYSLNRLAVNLGFALGGALGGFIAAHNYQWLFWIDGATNIFAAILLWRVLSPVKPVMHRHITEKADPRQSPYQDKVYLFFIAFAFLFAFCFFQLMTTMPVYYRNELRLTENVIGLILSMAGVMIVVFEMVLIFNLEGRKPGLWFISFGSLLVALSFLLLNLLPGGFWLAAGTMAIATIGEIFSFAFMNSFWISRTSTHNRGQYAGLYTIAWAAAQVSGPALGMQAAQLWSFRTLWWIVFALCLAAALGFRILLYRTDKPAGRLGNP